MNEGKFAVPRVTGFQWGRLPIIRLNRRLFLIDALLIASLQLLLTQDRSVAPPREPVPREVVLPSLAHATSPPQTIRLPDLMSEAAAWSVTATRHKNTSADRWEKFEARFGIAEREPSLVLGTVQTAKYNLDTLLFAVDDFTHNLSDSMQFEYGGGRFRRVSTFGEGRWHDPSDPMPAVLNNARLGLDLNITGGKPYVGVKLTLPLGD
jgi:hypothetical protein